MEPHPGSCLTAALFAKLALLLCVIVVSCHQPVAKINKEKTEARLTNKSIALGLKKKKQKKKLYLTFDDGPNKGTRNVLNIIEDEDVPASFFIVGEHVFASKGQTNTWDSLKIAEHIQLCNHSFTHAFDNHYKRFYEVPDSVVKDFKRCRDSLHLTNNIVRTPGRNIWRIDSLSFTDLKKSTAAADSLQKAGFKVMGWDVEWHYDPKTLVVMSTADEMITQIDSAFAHNRTMQKDHLVLLAHDQVYHKPGDSIELRRFIKRLKIKDEYELSLVTAYPSSSTLADTFHLKGQ